MKARLIEKLITLSDGKASQGVKDFLATVGLPKGEKYTA